MLSSEVIIYYAPFCPYCAWAQQLLDDKGVKYTLINVKDDDALRSEMEDRSNRNTVPQIFVGDYHVGGYDDLSALDRQGDLDPLLQSVQVPS
ncbi:MAG: glutaredoxin 3 [Gammaproteobacteria bacterium]|nr:glutaredoxin 3 [Gammaproteobacteria bacterium]MDH5735041.1 glutaredoxin 3 [Gammaproteobacteria bacterium]